MALIPDKGKMLFTEQNVAPDGGSNIFSAYDATLFRELGSSTRGVMVVKVICIFNFKDGESALPATKGNKLTWTDSDKTAWMADYKKLVEAGWSEKHRIQLTTPHTFDAMDDVGVVVEVDNRIGISTVTNHYSWELKVTKADQWADTSTQQSFLAHTVNLDSLDLSPDSFSDAGTTYTQRAAIHEFGHMLGHRDEYPSAKENLNWKTDYPSIMYHGETIRDRHYALFTAWVMDKFSVAAALAKEPNTWKVNGTLDVDHAQL
jgi:hypothetical protein